MTMSEFLGVRCGDIDIETGEQLSHSTIYRRGIERLGGLSVIKPYIPFGLDKIRKAVSEDHYLNNLPMREWDWAAGFTVTKNRNGGEDVTPNGNGLRNLYHKHGITSASCVQGVCILKEAARWWAEIETGNEVSN